MADEAKGLWASLVEMFGEAVDSVRHEVVERGWFGRQVTDVSQSPEAQSPAEQPDGQAQSWRPQSFEEQWAARDKMAPQGAELEHGQDIDR